MTTRARRYWSVALGAMVPTGLWGDVTCDTKITPSRDRGCCPGGEDHQPQTPDPTISGPDPELYPGDALWAFLRDTWQTVRDYDPECVGFDLWLTLMESKQPFLGYPYHGNDGYILHRVALELPRVTLYPRP